jgi:hypothetical protein
MGTIFNSYRRDDNNTAEISIRRSGITAVRLRQTSLSVEKQACSFGMVLADWHYRWAP